MPYAHTLGARRHTFADLRTLMARATPARSGDRLAGVAAGSAQERVAAQMALADLPLATFLNEAVVPYEDDAVTRLIIDHHDTTAFAPVASLTVGTLRAWLLGDAADSATSLLNGMLIGSGDSAIGHCAMLTVRSLAGHAVLAAKELERRTRSGALSVCLTPSHD